MPIEGISVLDQRRRRFKFFYLASPYSHPDAGRRHQNAVSAMTVFAKLLDEGRLGFCPIAHSHEVSLLMRNQALRDSYDVWMGVDLPLLRACEVMYILTLPGWDNSRGIKREMEEATQRRIPIRYIDEAGRITLIPNPDYTDDRNFDG